MATAREDVGAEELLSRCVFDPPMLRGGAVLAKLLFEFPGNQCESVVWHRYVADGLDGIHRMGCEKQIQARSKQKAAGKIPDKTYIGALSPKAKKKRSPFPSPAITTLSDKTSRLRPRRAASTLGQTYEPEVPRQFAVRNDKTRYGVGRPIACG